MAIPVLAVLAYYVHPVRVVDAHVLAWFSRFEYTTPTSYVYTTTGHVARAITFFAEPVPLLVIVGFGCAYAVRRRRPVDAVAALVIVAGANLTTQTLKHLLTHDRYEPFLAHHPNMNTFPSGHVTAAATIVVALVWTAAPARRRAIAWVGAAYVVLVGISTFVLEWHFPSDVLGALAVTGAWTFGVLAVYLRLAERRLRLRRGSRPGALADQLDDLADDLADVEVLRRVDAGDPRGT
ncbi:MAG: phosphatase PAP2 family protein [Actinobacteria bacterium]|nr:phosphatase PAP2 family protein [Actinomycetota bacterium]